MPIMTLPVFLISGSGPIPKIPRKLLIMPVSRTRETSASVRSRKLMHIGSVTSR